MRRFSILTIAAAVLAACPADSGDTGSAEDTTSSSTTDPSTTSTTVDPSTSTSTTDTTTTTTGTTGTTTTGTTGTTGSGTSESGSESSGGLGPCTEKECQNTVYDCGDCMDNDDDGLVDLADPDCWGPCDNNEAGWKGEVPGQQSPSECGGMDCYFDHDSGSGNDDCYWSHSCDPLEPSECTYDPDHNIGGTPKSCQELYDMQSQDCSDYCGPLTPNGCDCFGCCEVFVDGGSVTVYIGTEDDGDNGTCNPENVLDPELCNPCTQVPGCLNPCFPEECEVCFGEVEPPDDCEPKCEEGFQPCEVDDMGGDNCPPMQYCLTGCCIPRPQ